MLVGAQPCSCAKRQMWSCENWSSRESSSLSRILLGFSNEKRLQWEGEWAEKAAPPKKLRLVHLDSTKATEGNLRQHLGLFIFIF